MILVFCVLLLFFLILSFKLFFSLSSFTLIKKFFSSSSLSSIRVMSSAYLRLLIFLLAILIPACNFFSPAFHMMCSVYKLNKQGDNKQPCPTPSSILNESVVSYRVLIVASWPAHRFLTRQVRWSGIPISLRAFHRLPLWLSWLRIHLKCGRPGFDPWAGTIPWRRERLPTPVFWPGELHGLYNPWGHKESDMTEWLSLHFTVYYDPHTQRFWHSQWDRCRCFSGTPLLSLWSRECLQFELWFFCFF